MLRASTTRCTGIHLAPEAVYAVELVQRRGRTALQRCGRVRLEQPLELPDALVDGTTRADLVEALQTLQEGGFSLERPYFALAGTACFIKRRIVAPGSAETAREHLLWEAEQLLGADMDDYAIDTLVTARHGFFIAVRREILELYGVLCREAHAGKPGFDMTSFALYNAFERFGVAGEGSEAILQVDGSGARMILVRDGEFEGETGWSGEAEDWSASAARWLEEEMVDGQERLRLWLAGGGATDVASRLAESVDDLDPFDDLPMSTVARRTLDGADAPKRAWVVATGLAVRGLADA